MALIYNVEYKHTLNLNSKEIKFRAWTTKDEKDYLIARDSLEEIDDTMLFDLLALPCLENKDITLSQIEKKKVLIEIRKISLGSSFPMKYSCKKCKKINDLEVELEDIVTYKEALYSSVKIDNMVFEFSNNVSKSLYDRVDKAKHKVDKSFIELLVHIKSIEIDGQKEDDFTFEELNEFMNNIPSSFFDRLYPEFKKMKESINFSLTTFCIFCNNENLVDFDHLPNFLWT